MIKEGKIGVQEAITLIVIIISVKIYFVGPSMTVKALGTSTWYMTLISAATAIVGFTFIYILLKRFPDKDLVFAFEKSFGRLLGSIASIILSIMLLVNGAVLLREFSEVSKVYVIPETPLVFHIFTQIVVITIICFLGLETIARFSKHIGYFILLSFIGTIVFNYNHFDYHNLFPLLGYGIKPTVVFGLKESSFYGEVVILGVIAQSLQGTKHLKKIGFTSLIISGCLISAAYLSSTLIFRYSQAQEVTSLMYTMTRVIQLGFFFNRLDPIFIFSWSIGTLISVSTLFYTFLSTYCKAFRIQDMRPLIIPSAIILFALSMIPNNLMNLMSFITILRQYGWVVFFALPFAALIIDIIRKKKVIKNA
ncbi:endospore germination permease [Clostridium sp. YIM B02505]|uniref:Endospore germination permease n=1 Tax=Clostridium yunnanense TaxID=2800325 RepID=A0ABS1ESJ8_9CLOT|nr:endospore germination permease [Clostridium yunnanense]